MDRAAFERLVADALDGVPEPFASALNDVAVVVENHAPADDPDLYGLYMGTPLDEPPAGAGELPPSRPCQREGKAQVVLEDQENVS